MYFSPRVRDSSKLHNKKGPVQNDRLAPQIAIRNSESSQGIASESVARTLHQPWPFVKERA